MPQASVYEGMICRICERFRPVVLPLSCFLTGCNAFNPQFTPTDEIVHVVDAIDWKALSYCGLYANDDVDCYIYDISGTTSAISLLDEMSSVLKHNGWTVNEISLQRQRAGISETIWLNLKSDQVVLFAYAEYGEGGEHRWIKAHLPTLREEFLRVSSF